MWKAYMKRFLIFLTPHLYWLLRYFFVDNIRVYVKSVQMRIIDMPAIFDRIQKQSDKNRGTCCAFKSDDRSFLTDPPTQMEPQTRNADGNRIKVF